jgi:hypothetical protein
MLVKLGLFKLPLLVNYPNALYFLFVIKKLNLFETVLFGPHSLLTGGFSQSIIVLKPVKLVNHWREVEWIFFKIIVVLFIFLDTLPLFRQFFRFICRILILIS